MKFNEKIVALRKIKGITQDELASAVGVSRQAVYKWESGQSYPEVQKLIEMKLLFDISIDNLLDESFFIVGCAPAPYGESCLGHKNIALVIEEYDSGNRYWCHCPEDFIEDVREELAEEYKKIERIADRYANS